MVFRWLSSFTFTVRPSLHLYIRNVYFLSLFLPASKDTVLCTDHVFTSALGRQSRLKVDESAICNWPAVYRT